MNLLYHVFQALQLRSIDPGPTYIHFFNDKACQNASFVVYTDTNAADGPCGSLTGDGINSVNLTTLYPGCNVTTYTGPGCTNNKEKLSLGTCASISAGSYSVDCPALDGTVAENYTTILAASSSSVAASSPTSSSKSITFFPEDTSTATENSTSQFDIATSSPTTFSEAVSSTSTSSSFTASSSFQFPTSSTTSPQPPTSSTTSSSLSSTSSSQASTGSGKSGGNNKTKIIVPSVVIPVFIICVAIISVLWRRKFSKSPGPAIKDREKPVDSGSPPEAAIQPPRRQSKARSTHFSTVSASDTESTPSQFSALPKYPQAKLKNRTAESGVPEE